MKNFIAVLIVSTIVLQSCKKDIAIETPLKTYTGSLQFEFLPGSVEKVFSAQMPWESRALNYYNVIRKDANWSMWYISFGFNQYNFDGSFCFANSSDGKNWQRSFINNNTNILLLGDNATGVEETFVFFDEFDQAFPYKMICSKLVNGSHVSFLYSSPDGKRWKDHKLLTNMMQDSQPGVINFNGLYYIFSRYNDYSQGYQRAIGLSILDKNFTTIQSPLLLLKANVNSSFPHIYNNAASKINDSTVLLFPTFFNEITSEIRIKLIYTNNLHDYYLIDDNITNKLFPDGNVNFAIVSPGIIPTGENNTYWVYYWGTGTKHNSFPSSTKMDVTYYRIKFTIH